MKDHNKDAFLQIRVSPHEKAMIARSAKQANMSMSAWLLSKVLPSQEIKFHQLIEGLCSDEHNPYIYAELNDLLLDLSPDMFSRIVKEQSMRTLSSFAQNYLAAMVELAAKLKNVAPPLWTRQIAPLDKPYFGSDLSSLRLYLLTNAPPVFRRRNIFIDASLGDRV